MERANETNHYKWFEHASAHCALSIEFIVVAELGLEGVNRGKVLEPTAGIFNNTIFKALKICEKAKLFFQLMYFMFLRSLSPMLYTSKIILLSFSLLTSLIRTTVSHMNYSTHRFRINTKV